MKLPCTTYHSPSACAPCARLDKGLIQLAIQCEVQRGPRDWLTEINGGEAPTMTSSRIFGLSLRLEVRLRGVAILAEDLNLQSPRC